MTVETDDSKTVSEWMLYEEIAAAFREAKAHGLSWQDCEGVYEDALVKVFPERAAPP